jgi:hypothetical protein
MKGSIHSRRRNKPSYFQAKKKAEGSLTEKRRRSQLIQVRVDLRRRQMGGLAWQLPEPGRGAAVRHEIEEEEGRTAGSASGRGL